MKLEPLPESNVAVKLSAESRPDPPMLADERTMLCAYLDFQRETLALKCANVPGRMHSERLVPPSGLTPARAGQAPVRGRALVAAPAVRLRRHARHLGHADLLRERVDGATGW